MTTERLLNLDKLTYPQLQRLREELARVRALAERIEQKIEATR